MYYLFPDRHGLARFISAYFLSEQTSVVNGGQVSVVDFNELVQVLCLLHLVLKF